MQTKYMNNWKQFNNNVLIYIRNHEGRRFYIIGTYSALYHYKLEVITLITEYITRASFAQISLIIYK